MALRYYAIDKGEQEGDAVEAAVDPTKDVQVVVDLASNISRAEVIQKLKVLEHKILEGNWPPA